MQIENHAVSKSIILRAGIIVSVFFVAGIFIGTYANNHNKAIPNKNDLSGEVADFISTETDIRGYVVANDFKDARAKCNTLEHDWDLQERTLRPQNKSDWTQIDKTFDQVLTSVRTTTNITKCKFLIDNSLTLLDQINAGIQ